MYDISIHASIWVRDRDGGRERDYIRYLKNNVKLDRQTLSDIFMSFKMHYFLFLQRIRVYIAHSSLILSIRFFLSTFFVLFLIHKKLNTKALSFRGGYEQRIITLHLYSI